MITKPEILTRLRTADNLTNEIFQVGNDGHNAVCFRISEQIQVMRADLGFIKDDTLDLTEQNARHSDASARLLERLESIERRATGLHRIAFPCPDCEQDRDRHDYDNED